jgi:hypothetical protein
VEVLRKGARQTFSLEVEESNNDSGYNFWFDGNSFPRHRGESYFNEAPFEINVPEIDMERVRPHMEQFRMQMDQFRPHMEQFRIQMDQLRGRMREESNQLRERIQKEVRQSVRVHVQESI